MSSPDLSPRLDESLYNQDELRETPKVIYFYAPAIYGQDTKREELKEELNSVLSVEDDEDEADVIIVYYYTDEDGIDEDEVLQVVQCIDGSAHIQRN